MTPRPEKKPTHSQAEMMDIARHLNGALGQLEDMRPDDPKRGGLSLVAGILAIEVKTDLKERGINLRAKKQKKPARKTKR